jgi:hypothetical protein
MALIASTVVKDVLKQLDSIHSDVISHTWKDFSKSDFVSALDRAMVSLAELHTSLHKVEHSLTDQPAGEKPDIGEVIRDLEQLQALVNKNKDMELRKSRSLIQDINTLEQEESPELYAILEQKMLSFVLKARHHVERLSIFFHKHSPRSPLTEKGTARNLLSLLEQKETELADMREKYGSMRARSFMGHLEENAVADMEKEVTGLSTSLATNMERIRHSLSLNHKQLVSLDNEYAKLKEKINAVEDDFSGFVENSLELVSMLKKERDYARRVVMEIEHETVHLRSTYTHELLSLEEEKVAAKEQAKKMIGKRLDHAEAALKKAEKNEQHFHDQVLDQKHTIKELREQIHSLKEKLKDQRKHPTHRKKKR